MPHSRGAAYLARFGDRPDHTHLVHPIGFVNSVTQYVLVSVHQQRFLTKAFLIARGVNTLANLIFVPTVRLPGVRRDPHSQSFHCSSRSTGPSGVHGRPCALAEPAWKTAPGLRVGPHPGLGASAVVHTIPLILALAAGFLAYLLAGCWHWASSAQKGWAF